MDSSFLIQRLWSYSDWVTHNKGVTCMWGKKNLRLSTNNKLYLGNATSQRHSFYER